MSEFEYVKAGDEIEFAYHGLTISEPFRGKGIVKERSNSSLQVEVTEIIDLPDQFPLSYGRKFHTGMVWFLFINQIVGMPLRIAPDLTRFLEV